MAQAPAQDIRRQSGDVSPTNFIRPGVQDSSVADAIAGVGAATLEGMKEHTLDKLANELNSTRAEFIANSPVTKAYEQNAADGTPQDQVVAEQLGKALGPIRAKMDKLQAGKDQGVIGASRFKLQLDATVQQAIAAHPGLAPEIRELHAQYGGGALIEMLVAQEEDMLKAHMKEGADAAKAKEDAGKNTLELLNKSGFGAEAAEAMNTGGYDGVIELFHKPEVYAKVQGYARTAADSTYAQNLAQNKDAVNSLKSEERDASWNMIYSDESNKLVASIQDAAPKLASVQNDDELAGYITQMRGAIAMQKGRLEAAARSFNLSPDNIATRMKTFDVLEEQFTVLSDKSLPLQLRKNRAQQFVEQWKLGLFTDPSKSTLAELTKAELAGAPNVMNSVLMQTKAKTQIANQWVNAITGKAYDPTAIVPVAAGFTGDVLRSVFPQGMATDTNLLRSELPQAVATIALMGNSFAAMPDEKMKVKDFGDWASELDAYGATLAKHLTPDQKEQLSAGIRGGTFKAIKVAVRGLSSQYPELKGRLTAVDGEIAVKEGGLPLTPQARGALEQANRQVNLPSVLKVLTIMNGWSRDKAIGEINAVRTGELVRAQEAHRAQMEATQGGGSGGGGGSASGGHTGPATKWWK